jgi:catechol 2,3-dioxygenase-like lactoylglutathione lyase family enzyme
MIDHISLGSHQYAKSMAFYSRCFDTLGYSVVHEDGKQAIFGANGHWSFCIYPADAGTSLLGHRSHVAVSAPSKEAANAFHDTAVALGAESLRPPGPREDINPEYYGTMVKDLDGHTIEVVCWDRPN